MVVRSKILTFTLLMALTASVTAGCTRKTEQAPNPFGDSGYQGTGPVAGPGSMEEFNQTIGDTILFETDSYELSSLGQQLVARQAQWLSQYANYRILVEGHADERGTREYNLALGNRRAQSVRDALISQGVPAQRITTTTFGKERPVATCNDQSCWSQNRRTVTRVN